MPLPLSCIVTSPSPLLLSLGTALLAMLALASSLEPELSLFTSPLKLELSLFGALHVPTSQLTPPMLLREKPLRSHLRQGFPDLSSARRPALIAPVLAFGPSLCAVIGATPPNGPFLGAAVGSADRSMVPSALCSSQHWGLVRGACDDEERGTRYAGDVHANDTYRRGFFFGPGLPLGFGAPSDGGAALFVPGLGPGTPFLLPVPDVGGTSDLLSEALAEALGSGVALLVSDASSAGGGLMVGVAAGREGLSEDDGDLEAGECGNLAR